MTSVARAERSMVPVDPANIAADVGERHRCLDGENHRPRSSIVTSGISVNLRRSPFTDTWRGAVTNCSATTTMSTCIERTGDGRAWRRACSAQPWSCGTTTGSDQEAVESAAYDQSSKVALGTGEAERPFVKSTLQLFRAQLILYEKARSIFEASLAAARQVGRVKSERRMRAALDMTNILGRGEGRDTYNLIADGIVTLRRLLPRRPARPWRSGWTRTTWSLTSEAA